MTPARRPSVEINRQIELIKRSISNQNPLPDVQLLEGKITKLTTMALLDSNRKPDLHDAVQQLEQAKQAWATRARQNTELAHLANELSESESEERNQRVDAAERKLMQAKQEYAAACLVCARALRTVMNASHAAAQVQGARYGISDLRVEQFNIPSLFGISNSGTLGQSMTQGLQHFEMDDLRMAA